MRALSEGLKVNTALESLHLGGNLFYGAGGEELALALHSHKVSACAVDAGSTAAQRFLQFAVLLACILHCHWSS